MNILAQLILSCLSVAVAAYVLPGVELANFQALIVVVIILGVINAVLKPLISLIILPFNILTFGLLGLLINGLIVLLLPTFIPGFIVHGYWSALWFSIVLSLINLFFGLLGKKR